MNVETIYGDFYLPDKEDLIVRALEVYGEWSKIELDLLAEFIREGDIVLDVGGFVGTHARAFSIMVGNKGKVYTFEPNRCIYRFLKRNSQSSPYNNITSYNYGLGEEGFYPFLYENTGNMGGGKVGELIDFNKSKHILDDKENYAEIRKLDSLNLDGLAFIKADVEGMEYKVLEGGRNTIQNCQPFIFVEVNSLDASNKILNWTYLNNYKAYGVLSKAFNTNNFKANMLNIFGDAKECGLLLIPQKRPEWVNKKIQLTNIPLIQTLDDMALLFLHKPQYLNEILEHTNTATVFGLLYHSPLVANKNEIIKGKNQEINNLKIYCKKNSALVSAREREIVKLINKIDFSQKHITHMKKILELKNKLILKEVKMRKIYESQYFDVIGSNSWNITKPLRSLLGFLKSKP